MLSFIVVNYKFHFKGICNIINFQSMKKALVVRVLESHKKNILFIQKQQWNIQAVLQQKSNYLDIIENTESASNSTKSIINANKYSYYNSFIVNC